MPVGVALARPRRVYRTSTFVVSFAPNVSLLQCKRCESTACVTWQYARSNWQPARRRAVVAAAEQPVPTSSASSRNSQPLRPPDPEKKDVSGDQYRGTLGEFGRFVRIVATALLFLLVLFFFDILAGLAALTLGSFYAIAILFGVRDADLWVPRLRTFVVSRVIAVAHRVRDMYRFVRREIRSRLEDD